MKEKATALLLFALMVVTAFPLFAQAPREDVIWARSTDGAAITLDGVLDEPAWAVAESMTVRYGENAGIPGSGWKLEVGFPPTDKTNAKLKLLTVGNYLYLGAVVPDSSVGGGTDFNRFDGFLMSIKDHADPGAPKPPAEYFYSWWYPEGDPEPAAPGKDPAFVGKWATWPPGTPRDSAQIANWDAVTMVNGLTNDDATINGGYTVEMLFNLTPMGYDVTQPDGDVVEWNISIYDADWFWPIDFAKVSGNRVWWQGPWGNAAIYNEVRVHTRPDVTVNSGPVPPVGPEMRITNGSAYGAPTIDGVLDEAVWDNVPSFDMRWNDDALRQTYPGVGPWRAGQYQDEVQGGTAAVLDSADATVKMFFVDDILYFGFDVRDKVVQYHPNFSRWDGFLVLIDDRGEVGPDSNLVSRRLAFQVAQDGTALPAEYLPYLIDTLNGGEVALTLKPGTTVDTIGADVDAGYTAELAVDLTKLGYPAGLGDRTVFLGLNLLDGDSFIPSVDSYGCRVWWFREYDGTCCPVWAYLDPTCLTVGVDEGNATIPFSSLVDNYPNPFKKGTTLRYVLTERSDVTLEVYDVRGRLVERRDFGQQEAGLRHADFSAAGRASGVYFYRLRVSNEAQGGTRTTTGKMVLLD